jgi:aldose 1-epimerase
VEPPVQIASDRITMHVDPSLGGRVAQLWIDGTAILVGRDDVPDVLRLPDGSPPATAWGAYPMVPWAGRIRRGRFEFRGREYSLPINFGDHAIHGVGFSSAWTVVEHEPHDVRLALELPTDASWPFGGRVTQHLTVAGEHVLMRMEVTAADLAFPMSFGWHPWFRKPSRMSFHPARMYRRDDEGIAVDELVPVPPGPWDDCFTNTLPVAVTIDGVDLEITSDCSNWVVFDEFPHATCIEPQTGPPDSFTIAPRVLEPGRTHAAWARISIVNEHRNR